MSGPNKIPATSTSPHPRRPEPTAIKVVPASAPGAFEKDMRLVGTEGERQYQIAQAWNPDEPRGMTGVEANKAITGAYAWLDGRMSDYLGDPAIANWTTFGKYASREAGGQIQRFEALEGMLNENSFKQVVNNALGLLHDFIGHRESLSRQSRLMRKVSKGPDDYAHNVGLMRDTLVNGNAAIMHDIGPAFQTFLSAEEKGQNGLEALKAAGYGQAPKDRQGFLLRAFEGYQQAQGITKRLKTEQLDPKQREDLTAQRRELVFQANLLVGIQEQMYALQTKKTFANHEVQELMKSFTPTMELADAVNRMPLLPNGGNWANFHQRMGFKQVFDPNQPGVMTIPDVKGNVRHYVVNPDVLAREGTIFEYFRANMDPEVSRRLIDASPATYPTMYDGTMGRIKSGWGWIKKKLGFGAEDPLGAGELARLIDDAVKPLPAKP
jgi:hypothetical protein